MATLKPFDDLRQRVAGFPIDSVEWDGDLEDLFAIAHIDRAGSAHWAIERRAQPLEPLGFHFLEELL